MGFVPQSLGFRVSEHALVDPTGDEFGRGWREGRGHMRFLLHATTTILELLMRLAPIDVDHSRSRAVE